MIPTTLSANNSPTASSLNSSNSLSGAATIMANASKEMVIGLASLIIEGRAFAEDEFHMLSLRQMAPSSSAPPRGGASYLHSTDLHASSSSPSTTTPQTAASTSSSAASLLLHTTDIGAASSSSLGASGGRQSPKPSTSKAAIGQNSNLPLLINITTNPHHAFGAKTAPLFIETPNAYHSSSSAASSAESTHQRWTQKLCQLRQASGAANLAAPYEQKVAIDAAQSTSGEPELVSLAIHDPSTAAERGAVGGGDYEIVRRVMLSRSAAAASHAATMNMSAATGSASSSPSSGGSENFLHSLQSLATTCLRGSSPSMDSPTGFTTLHYNPSSGGSSSGSHTKYAPYRATANTANSTPRFHSPYAQLDLQTGSASSSGSGVQSPKLMSISSHSHKRGPKATSTVTSGVSSAAALNIGGAMPCALMTPKATAPTSAFAVANSPSICSASGSVGGLSSTSSLSLSSSSTTKSATQCSNSNSNPYPQQGPHCDQFLRKMGLAKGEAAEAEEHYCDMSYVNITCSRWRAYCLKIEAIIERGEPICLEVFLGPANNKILLEQWIITCKEKVPPPTMTLPSLCSAIRSQLYFSQISAWCDLIRKSDKSIYDTGRIVYGGAAGMMGCAGDLATTNLSCTPPNSSNNSTINATSASGGTAASGATSSTSSSSTSSSSPFSSSSRPRLNVFYRIRTHDATACFNSKPNIHNFPNVNISENCSISICLKSLPRINGGIPKLGATMAAPGDNVVPKFLTDETPRSSRQNSSKLTASSLSSSAACYSNCDKQKQQQQVKDVVVEGSANGASSSSNIAYSKRYKNTTAAQLAKACSAAIQVNKIECKSVLAATPTQAAPLPPTSPPTAATTAASASTTASHTKCKFYIDEADQSSLDADIADFDDELSEPHCSNGSCGSLSHREKQLLKYRKRMLKRDKKHHHNRRSFDDSSSQTSTTQQQCQPMEQGDDYEENVSEQSSVQTVTLVTARQRAVIEMISTGTQTAATGCCEHCGSEKALICLKCNAGGVDEMDACSVNSLSSTEIISTPRSKGDLLLQAIQRTPKAAKHKKQTGRSAAGYLNTANSAPSLQHMRSSRSHSIHNTNAPPGESLNNNHLANRSSSVACASNSTAFNSLSPCSSSSSIASLGSGCQVCKRQKTQHNFAAFNSGGGRDVDNCAENQHYSENGAAGGGAEVTDVNESADERDGGKHFDVKCHIDMQLNDIKMSTSESSCDLTASQSTMRAEEEGEVVTRVQPQQQKLMSTATTATKKATANATGVMEEECFVSSTKLTPNFEGFVLSGKRSNSTVTTVHQQQQQTGKQQQQTQPPPLPPKPLRHGQCESSTATYQARSCTPTAPLALNIDCEFKTPTSTASVYQEQQQQQNQTHKPTPKPTLLQVANAYSIAVPHASQTTTAACCSSSTGTALTMPQSQRKTLPKVNLTPIFCNGNTGACNMLHHSATTPMSMSDSASSQSPESAFPFDIVTINRVKFERAAQMCTANNNNHHHQQQQQHYNNNNNNNCNNNISNNNNTATIYDCNNAAVAGAAVPVQKSNSAPTLPNSPSLSPRFAKQAAIYKRRSRHLSDRSDRSSLGSDEQYSDEDLDCGSNANLMNGMVISPMKQRARFAAKFSRRPLLGNLEESLLQRRITPKMEVLGFKVLLGASGVFCPTQLTIPAAAYFYELHGETLSTPYLCEIGLPRKGYSVPRTGTVQVTLLNPLGTVVRMFVIPYDMHDMPPLHQTFIRQRVLAEMSAFSDVVVTDKQNGFDHLSSMQNGDSHMQHSGESESNYQSASGSTAGVGDNCKQKSLGHFISAEHMKRLRYCIHLRFQTSRSGRLMLHTDIRLLISRRTDCDTAAAHAKGLLEAPNELITDTVMPSNPKYSVRHDVNSRI